MAKQQNLADAHAVYLAESEQLETKLKCFCSITARRWRGVRESKRRDANCTTHEQTHVVASKEEGMKV